MQIKNRKSLFLLTLAAGGALALVWGNLHPKPSPFVVAESQLSGQAALGKALFEDPTLSEPAGLACASCHEAKKAFQGNHASSIAAVAEGSRKGHFGTRNVPSLAYAFLSPRFHFEAEKNDAGETEWKAVGGQFMDGRAVDQPAQAEGPLLHPDEMNNASVAQVVAKVRRGPHAVRLQQLFGAEIFASDQTAFAAIANAIAAYESSAAFAPYRSKFDRVLAGQDRFSALEAKGFELFKDEKKGNCIACHVGKPESSDPRDWPFTDFTYDNLGVPRNSAIPANADANHYDLGLCDQKGLAQKLPRGVARESLCGAFKVPTLRNVAITGPYMHNGRFRSLREAVDFYATRDTHPERWYPKTASGVLAFDDLPPQYRRNVNHDEVPYDRKPGETPRLNPEEIDAITAFLRTLTDE